MGCSLRLQRFCCCCSLKTGTLVIGTIGWIMTLIQIIYAPMNSDISNKHSVDDGEAHSEQNAIIVRIGTGLLSLLISGLLVVGVYKKNNKFILPWLVLQCLGCIILSILCLVLFVLLFGIPSERLPWFLGFFIAVSSLSAFNIYCWLCVWSHYMDLNDLQRNISPNAPFRPPGFMQAPPVYTKQEGVPFV